jgi:hypothetical protein
MKAMKERRAAKEKDVNGGHCRDRCRSQPGLRDSPVWKSIKADWRNQQQGHELAGAGKPEAAYGDDRPRC